MVVGGGAQGGGAISGGVHVVVPRAQIDPQRAHDLRLVVDDQDASHEAAGRERIMVRPPPGVSSGVRVPLIASVRPRDSARPRPAPVWLSRSPSRWNGRNTSFQRSLGMPGPWSMTRSSMVSPWALAVTTGGRSSGL